MQCSFCTARVKAVIVIICALLAGPVFAEVLILSDGKVLVGSIVGPVDEGIAYTVSGQQVVLRLQDIIRTEQKISGISDVTVVVSLKDGSRIRGTIADYDEEIGTFVDIGFGVLTVPVSAINEMYDPILRSRYAGTPLQVHAGAGMYVPLLKSSDNFGPSWTTEAVFLYALPFYRGLYTGLSFSVSEADYTPDTAVDYYFITVSPVAEFQYFGWRTRKDLLSRVTPFTGAAIGMAYISVTDPSIYPETQGTLTGNFGLYAGADFSVTPKLTARIKLTGTFIPQATNSFIATGAGIFLCYEP